jgi:hypothetical protein
MDLYRSVLITLKARGGSDGFLQRFSDMFAGAIDPVQAVFDRQEFCSEIHVVAAKTA